MAAIKQKRRKKMSDLKAEREELIDALDHISRTAKASATQTRRLRWIAHRADSAIQGEDWRDIDLPKKKEFSDREKLQRAKIQTLEQRNRELEEMQNFWLEALREEAYKEYCCCGDCEPDTNPLKENILKKLDAIAEALNKQEGKEDAPNNKKA